MAYKVVFAPTAIARLEDIVRYIAADDPATASTFAMHLLDRAELLSEFPELGTPYRKRKNVRRLRCDPYLLSRAPRKPSDRSDGFLAFSSNGTELLICFASRHSPWRRRILNSYSSFYLFATSSFFLLNCAPSALSAILRASC